jgi:FdhE protein
MKETWDALIQRAGHLAAKSEATKELLSFYAELLRAQKEIYESLRGRKNWLPTGVLEEDLTVVRTLVPGLLRVVEVHGPAALVEEARALLRIGDDKIDEMLLAQWREPIDAQFFAKAFLQPYARWLAESGWRPVDRVFERHESRCPFCGGRPQVSFLQAKEASAESGNRDLICATCLTTWPFRRVVCAYCCEERPAKLGYFHSPEFGHIRVEACDTCNRYIKGVDLTRLGLAVPLVDEVVSAPLDLWAQEHGYTKIELNLVGL